MADVPKAEKQKEYNIPTHLQYKAKSEYEEDWAIHRQFITTFDPLEAMLIGIVYDSVSNTVDTSKITDSYAMTLAKERADRVMAKLPDGRTESMGRSDIGKAAFMDILRQKWIYPNANAQHSLMEKFNMWQLYSSVYGYMPMFYDWNVSPSGYVGPDCWLWSPRNFIPQQGRPSINEMDYVTALTWVSQSYLEGIREQMTGNKVAEDSDITPETAMAASDISGDNAVDKGGWDLEALDLLITIAKLSSNPDAVRDTKVVRMRTPQPQKRGVMLATRFESGPEGQWVTFAPDHGCIEVRRLDNPHKNGRIPFVIKYSQPLFDSFYGIGDFQRAKPLQFARDGLVNFYFKGIKMNLIPPLVANANGVLKHTLDYREGAVMLETIPNSIRRLETSTAGLATFQAAQDALTGSLLSLYGSQNASQSAGAALNPSQGKTPQAINLYADKEATRDGSERRHLEDAIQQLTDGFFSLVVNIGTETIPVQIFAADIANIVKSGLTDLTDIFKEGKGWKPDANGAAGDLEIDPAKLKGIEYRFKIDPNSTSTTNKQQLIQELNDILGVIGKFQNIFTEDPRFTINWDQIMSTFDSLSDIPNADKFISFDPSKPSKQEVQLQQEQAKQTTPSGSSIQMPNGQVHELADLGKLYLNTNDWWVKNQILEALGFQPAPPSVQAQIGNATTNSEQSNQPGGTAQPQGPMSTTSGHMFHDPQFGAAAEAINNFQATPPQAGQPQQPQQPQGPPAGTMPDMNVTKQGHAFHDPTIAAAAEAINNTPGPKMAPSLPKPGQPAMAR